jgi:hypothetical protein
MVCRDPERSHDIRSQAGEGWRLVPEHY